MSSRPLRVVDWREATVGSLLVDAVRRWPDRIAVQWPADGGLRALTWRQVWQHARQGAVQLNTSPQRGPVAIYAPNGPGWYIALWAVALSGLPLVPINPALTQRELVDIIESSCATTVLAARDFRGRDLVAVAQSHAVCGLTVADIDQWYATAGPATLDGDVDVSDPIAMPADTFVIQYTSGTTGKPKGAVLSHRVCVNAALTMIPGWRCTDDEVCCSALPLHHIGALTAHALAFASIGAQYVLLSSAPPRQFIETAQAAGATMLAGVPTTYLRLLDDPELASISLPNVRVLMIGGASIPAVMIQRIEDRFGARASVMYGQSEAPAITVTDLDDPDWVKAYSVGRTLPMREVRVVDVGTQDPAGCGQVGEIWVRTPIRMDGYHGDPSSTRSAIDENGWLHTGDLGSLDAEGLLYFHGRLRDMIVRGGENIYPREIEAILEDIPDVEQAAVLGLPDPEWGEIVGAAVVLRPGALTSVADLSAWVARRVAPFKRPAVWRIVDELPMTASGKPQKFKIAQVMAPLANPRVPGERP